MTPLDAAGPNAEQIRYWNEVSGPKWVELQDRLDAMIGPIGSRAMERGRPASGERVLDVGCGCGSTSLELARRVAPDGRVVGLDISATMLDAARARARREGVDRVAFENADAQTHAFLPPPFDLVFSRFGVMFFSDPAAAFGNLRRALRPGGRLAFACWQGVPKNPWVSVPLAAVAQHIALPPPPAPGSPGPFAFADPDRVRSILTAAGFADVAFEPLEMELAIAGGADGLAGATEFVLQLGPAAAAAREAGGDAIDRIRPVLHEVLAPYWSDRGGLRMASACWIVTAGSPAT